ncbi:hypothetical protein OG874_26105 [Nocardia sp. NBC_00565]|uniref:hypothetical protein n=1 Tax=Nocardia sp. NBC_00565 TaxID=2975993 RepID=UPI002E809D06|nr:hypothetical protein [Nocardia sp. NBC_00565]WUC00365.1 hypothetical protein OG874_26105 [Nocardia sp. NBC_00565]
MVVAVEALARTALVRSACPAATSGDQLDRDVAGAVFGFGVIDRTRATMRRSDL